MTVFSPQSEAEVADIFRGFGRRRRLRLCGGGTRLPLGEGPALSSRALTGVTRYEPEDFTISVRAGTPLTAVKKRLGEASQRLAFEPPMPSRGNPTIGAVAAMNLSGPRRPFVGAARDALVGLRLVTGLGEAISTGSRVLKNVAGLDLTKLVAGSRGSLGLITEVTFKTGPCPESTATLVALGQPAADFPTKAAEALRAGAPVTGATHLSCGIARQFGFPAGPLALLRLEGSVAAVGSAVDQVGPGFLPLDAPDQKQLWYDIRDAAPFMNGCSGSLWRIPVSPAVGGVLAQSLNALGAETIVDWRGGLIWAHHEDPDRVRSFTSVLAKHSCADARLIKGPALNVVPRDCPVGASRLIDQLRRALDPNEVLDDAPLHVGLAM